MKSADKSNHSTNVDQISSSKRNNEPISSPIQELGDDSVHFTIRCLASVPDELIDLLEEVEKQDMKEAGIE